MIRAWGLRLILTIGAALMLFGAPAAAAQQAATGDPLRICLLRDDGGADPRQLIRRPQRQCHLTPQPGSSPRNPTGPLPSLHPLACSWWRLTHSGRTVYARYADDEEIGAICGCETSASSAT